MYLLMYHEVTAGKPDDIHAVSAASFHEQVSWLRDSGWSVASLDEWVAAGAGTNSEAWRSKVIITFDDGYLDSYTNAWPILKEFGFGATVFLIAGLMGGMSQWREGALGTAPLMTWAQAREMAGYGVGLGAHTMSHTNLATVPFSQAEFELRQGRELLTQNLSRQINTFSYPYSGINGALKQLVAQSGYMVACSCPTGYVGQTGLDRYDLQRITVLATDTLDDFRQKITGTVARRLQWYRRQVGRWRRQLLKSRAYS